MTKSVQTEPVLRSLLELLRKEALSPLRKRQEESLDTSQSENEARPEGERKRLAFGGEV